MIEHPKFKTKEEVEEYLGGEKIECLLCGKSFKALSHHIARSHTQTIKEYHDLFDIPYNHTLIAPSTKKKLSINSKKHMVITRKAITAKRDKNRYKQKGAPKLKTIGYQQEKRKQHMLKYKVSGKKFIHWPKDLVDSILKLVADGESVTVIGKRPNMPSRIAILNHIKREPNLKKRYQEALNKRSIQSCLKAKQTPKKVIDSIVELRNQGVSVMFISKKWNISENTVRKYYRNYLKEKAK